jgi:hypothetical protein
VVNKQNTTSKNNYSNCSQTEIINGYANNNSIYTNEKSLSSIFQNKVRVKSYITSQTKLNLLEKENNDSFISNNDCLNINNIDNEKESKKINESEDILNNNFDFNELQTEEHENGRLKINIGKGKISDFDLLSIKFPVFTCESTKNKNNNSNLFNGLSKLRTLIMMKRKKMKEIKKAPKALKIKNYNRTAKTTILKAKKTRIKMRKNYEEIRLTLIRLTIIKNHHHWTKTKKMMKMIFRQ